MSLAEPDQSLSREQVQELRFALSRQLATPRDVGTGKPLTGERIAKLMREMAPR